MACLFQDAGCSRVPDPGNPHEHRSCAQTFAIRNPRSEVLKGVAMQTGERGESYLNEQCHMDEFLSEQERVLEVRARVLGEEHPDTLTSMGNLAVTLSAQGDHAGARQLEERVLEVRKRVLGEEHPSTLTSMGNLAVTLSAQGDHAGARQLQERVLEVRTRMLGEEHPDTLNSMWNLGLGLLDVGRVDAALRMRHKCFNGRYKVLGDQHPDTMEVAKFLMGLEQESESGGTR